MAKFYGVIGYAETVEVEPGIWEEQIVEHQYYGDLVRKYSRYQQTGGVNDDIVFSSNISIVADPYANQNFQHMRYVKIMGAKWTITGVDVQRPRLILTTGGVYNEQTTNTSN